MPKTKKKRTKRYAGAGAAQGPVVHRYEAVERSRFGQWREDHKTRLRIIRIAVIVLIVAAFIISAIVTLVQ